MANEFIARKGLIVSGSTQLTGSLNVSRGITGSLFGTSSWANNTVTASVATIAQTSSYFSGSILIVGEAQFPAGISVAGTSRLNGPVLVTGSISSSVGFFGTGSGIIGVISSSFATSASLATTASYALSATATVPAGTVSSSLQFNSLTLPFTGSFTGSFIGTHSGSTFGTASWASNVISSSFATTAATASYFTGSVTFPSGLIVTGSILATTVSASSFIGPLAGTASFATSASFAPPTFPFTGSAIVSGSVRVTGSLNITGSVTASNVNLVSISNTTNANSVLVLETATGKIFTTSSVGTGGGGSTFPFNGNAVITGSLIISGSNALSITGSATVLGAFQATTKSFKIDHQRLLGKKLIYGVLEGPEHGVYVRGRLTQNNIIQLPEEWKWLVDPDSITVQLTPIGTQQILYVQNIENNTVIINSNTPIDCFYFVQATRKDVAPLTTVE